jgi:hypothetical protein
LDLLSISDLGVIVGENLCRAESILERWSRRLQTKNQYGMLRIAY